MKINIPCPTCGCQYCDAKTKAGDEIKIEICRCFDGSGEFEVTISSNNGSDFKFEKYQCKEEEIEDCLISRFDINLESMSHKCFK